MLKFHRLTAILLVVPVLLLALGLRLNEMHDRSLWLDEAVEFNIAARPLPEVVLTDQNNTHDPPLFSLALNLWMQLDRTDFYVRLFPVIASVLATAVTFVLGRAIFSIRAGWFSALLVAVAPRAVYYGFELNQYAFVLLLTVLGTLLLERYLKQPTSKRLAAFLMTSLAAIFTHYELAIYWIPLVGVGTLALLRKREVPQRRRLFSQWFGGLGVLLVAGLILLGTYALPQKARLPADYAPDRFSGAIAIAKEVQTWAAQTNDLVRTLLWGFDAAPLAWLTTGWLIIGLIVCLFQPGSRRLALYFIGSVVLAYLTAGAGFLIYWHRYVLYALPLAVLLICGGTFILVGTGPYERYLRPAAYLALSILAFLLCLRLPAFSGRPFPDTEQFGQVMQYFQPRYKSGDAVYVYYGAQAAFRRYGTDPLIKTAKFQGWARGVAPEKQQAELWKAVGNAPRVWVLISHSQPSDVAVLPTALKSRCRQTDAIEVIGSAGYLFECASP